MKSIEVKFFPGQKVWVISQNRPMSIKISFITITETDIIYHLDNGFDYKGEQLAETKEELKDLIFG